MEAASPGAGAVGDRETAGEEAGTVSGGKIAGGGKKGGLMNITRILYLVFLSLDPIVHLVVGVVIGMFGALLIQEHRGHGRMTENDLLRWQNRELLQQIEKGLQSPDCIAMAAPKPAIAIIRGEGV